MLQWLLKCKGNGIAPIRKSSHHQRGGRGGDRRQRDDDRRPREPRETDAPKQTATPSPQTEEVNQENTTEESAE